MNIMLASFGLAQDLYWNSKGKNDSLKGNRFFFQAPPFFQNSNYIELDVTPFILYDKIIINKAWLSQVDGWGKVIRKNSLLNSTNVAELIQHGIVEPRDYKTDTLTHLNLLEKITNFDLSDLSLWREAIKESTNSWKKYVLLAYSSLQKILLPENLVPENPVKNREVEVDLSKIIWQRAAILFNPYEFPTVDDIPDDELRPVIQNYLLNTNNSFLLAREYSSSIFDWFDFEPFYTTKLMRGKIGPTSTISTVSRAGTMLSYYVPMERITSVQDLMRIRDKAKGLREYIEAKQWDDRGADEETMLKILFDIQHAQRKIESYKHITSYFTLPMALIPIAGPFIEKIANDIIDWQIEKRFLEEYRWHFSLLQTKNTYYLKEGLNYRVEFAGEHLSRDGWTRAYYKVNGPLRATDPDPYCRSFTKKGGKCRNRRKPESIYCWLHEAQNK